MSHHWVKIMYSPPPDSMDPPTMYYSREQTLGSFVQGVGHFRSSLHHVHMGGRRVCLHTMMTVGQYDVAIILKDKVADDG